MLKKVAGVLTNAVTGTDYQSGILTATRIPYATGNPGTLTDAASLTFDGTNVAGTGYARFDGGLGIGGAPGASFLINYLPILASNVFKGINMVATTTYSSGNVTFARGQDFGVKWLPTTTSTRSAGNIIAAVAASSVDTTNITTSNNITVTSIIGGCQAVLNLIKGASHSGLLTAATGVGYYANTPLASTGAVYTHNYAFYDQGQVIDGTKTPDAWGIGINTANNYINGNLNVGAAAASGIANGINTVGGYAVSGVAGITATVTYVDTLLGAKTLTFTKGILTAQV
jgi:hypothetical protein